MLAICFGIDISLLYIADEQLPSGIMIISLKNKSILSIIIVQALYFSEAIVSLTARYIV